MVLVEALGPTWGESEDSAVNMEEVEPVLLPRARARISNFGVKGGLMMIEKSGMNFTGAITGVIYRAATRVVARHHRRMAPRSMYSSLAAASRTIPFVSTVTRVSRNHPR